MVSHTTALVALGLCLGQVMDTQEGALPRPSISAEPGSVIPRGRPVTIVCRGPAGEVDFRLEKNGGSLHWDERISSPSETEARFLFPSMSEDTAGLYHCRYLKSLWSEPSEDLKLVLSREDTIQAPTQVPAQPSGCAMTVGPAGSCLEGAGGVLRVLTPAQPTDTWRRAASVTSWHLPIPGPRHQGRLTATQSEEKPPDRELSGET